MRKLFSLFIIFLISSSLFAQVTQQMSYQAIIRDTNKIVIANSTVGMRISILQGAKNGSAVYSEIQSPTTNANGLINIQVGSGIPITGKFETIDWAKGPYYIKTETNLSGGTTFNDPHQPVLVACDLYAHGIGSEAPGGAVVNSTAVNKNIQSGHYVGEIFGGGIIFYVNKDSNGKEHGLIASLTDLSSACIWSNMSDLIGPSAESTWNGKANTRAIILQDGHKRSAALLCDTSTNGGQNDWYLPSMQELNMLWNKLSAINKALENDGDPETTPLSEAIYWSSTEDDATTFAWYFGMYDAGPNGDTAGTSYKTEMYHVRAIRSF